MSSVTFPISLTQPRPVNTLKELRANQKALEKVGPQLQEALKFQERVDDWVSVVKSYDDKPEDYAAPKPGAVVLFEQPTGSSRGSVLLTGEWQSGERTSSATVEFSSLGEVESKLTYKKNSKTEVYTESINGEKRKLLVDHARGTMTFTDDSEPEK